MELSEDRKKMGFLPGVKKILKKDKHWNGGWFCSAGEMKARGMPPITEKNTPIHNCMFA